MSRPRKAAAEKRTHPVTFWLTEAEFTTLAAAADRAGLRVNELARRITLRGRRRLVVETTRRHDPVFIAQIKRLGVNLNQIVKRAHLREYVSPNVEALCDEIQRIVLSAANDQAPE